MLNAQGIQVRGLSADSRAVHPGEVFLAYPGHGGKSDGRAYIADAVKGGAQAVLWEREGYAWPAEISVPNFPIDGLKALAGPLAGEVYGLPSEQLTMVGVTGTNGKTSVSQWVAQALTACGRSCGVIGTLGAQYGGWSEAVPNTTPDAIVLQRTLKRMFDGGASACAMEASSIGLDQARVAGVAFDIAVFTNFTRDHLDYHGNLAAYEAAKTKLFRWPGLTHAVVNIDDAMGVRLMAKIGENVTRITYCIAGKSAVTEFVEDEGRLTASAIRYSDTGLSFELASDLNGTQMSAKVGVPVWGEFNVSNLLAVIGSLIAAGIGFDQAVGAVRTLAPLPGRMNALSRPGAPLAVIDYAHTPDALEQALKALRPIAESRVGALVVVFGCGGDRDAGKRPQMGAVAAKLADRVLITSDNPRSEDPLEIIRQILPGAPGAAVEADRAKAIARALAEAQPRDVLLIAGKGHEDYQEIGAKRLPFSDHEVARIALENRA